MEGWGGRDSEKRGEERDREKGGESLCLRLSTGVLESPLTTDCPLNNTLLASVVA